MYPLLPLLRETLRPGDIILDTWCRTGWSGELLAGLFPEQRVISIWEGNSNVLGYKGFAHWLGEGPRAANLDIIFTHPDHALPLANNSVRVVHGLDSLHRYRHASFIPECLRVCADDGVLVFPHIHLSNSEPEPFFERGCQHYHGREWKAWLDKTLAGTSRSAWVLSEAALFEAEQDFTLTDQSDTTHCNGLVLIADKKHQGSVLAPCPFPALSARSRLVLNPLLDINLHQCEVTHNAESLAGQASDMMARRRLQTCGNAGGFYYGFHRDAIIHQAAAFAPGRHHWPRVRIDHYPDCHAAGERPRGFSLLVCLAPFYLRTSSKI